MDFKIYAAKPTQDSRTIQITNMEMSPRIKSNNASGFKPQQLSAFKFMQDIKQVDDNYIAGMDDTSVSDDEYTNQKSS